MLEPRNRIPLLYNNGESLVYGINVGKYPFHHFAGNFARELSPSLPLKVDFCGHDEWIRGCYRKRVLSNVFSIEFVQSGRMMFSQNGTKYRVNPGDVFFVHRRCDSEMYADDGHMEKIAFSLSGHMLDSLLESSGLAHVDALRPRDPEVLRQLMDEAFSNIKAQDAGYQLKCSAIAYRVLLELGVELMAEKHPPMVYEALKLMDCSLGGQMTIDDFCERLGTSPATLNRAFRKHLQMPPMEYFIKMKMDSACRLLRYTNLTVKEIAGKTGYSNQLYFSSEFRKRIGVSPKAFRKGEGVV